MHRWNFAGAVQAKPSKLLLEGVKVIEEFNKYYAPERTRVVILYPSMKGAELLRTMDFLHSIDCEAISVYDRSDNCNGLVYADFFDFT